MADRGKKARERPREAQKLALRQHPPRNCARIPRLDECGRGLLLLLRRRGLLCSYTSLRMPPPLMPPIAGACRRLSRLPRPWRAGADGVLVRADRRWQPHSSGHSRLGCARLPALSRRASLAARHPRRERAFPEAAAETFCVALASRRGGCLSTLPPTPLARTLVRGRTPSATTNRHPPAPPPSASMRARLRRLTSRRPWRRWRRRRSWCC